jgi:tetratricopeptide (TPR) repeat protein
MKNDNELKDMFANAMSEFLKNNYGKSLELLNHILDRNPDHKLALIARGTAHLKLNLAEAAIADFSRAISVDPSYPRAFHMRELCMNNRVTATRPWRFQQSHRARPRIWRRLLQPGNALRQNGQRGCCDRGYRNSDSPDQLQH